MPRITQAVGDRAEILFDGGVQTGQDVLKARALGARCSLIGKAYLYGLGALGHEGVRKAISFIRKEMDVTMMLTGNRDVETIDESLLDWTSDDPAPRAIMPTRPGLNARANAEHDVC